MSEDDSSSDHGEYARGYDDGFERATKSDSVTEQQAIDAIVASQKAAGDPIDPNGARKLVRALIAVGLFKPA